MIPTIHSQTPLHLLLAPALKRRRGYLKSPDIFDCLQKNSCFDHKLLSTAEQNEEMRGIILMSLLVPCDSQLYLHKIINCRTYSRNIYISIRRDTVFKKKTKITNVGEDVEKLELFCIAGGNVK